MMPAAEILAVLCLGLACWAIGASLAAWKWRRSYLGALAQYRQLLEWVRNPRIARPTKSEPHVKAARTRAARAKAKVQAGLKQLQAEIHARELGW